MQNAHECTERGASGAYIEKRTDHAALSAP